MAIEAAQIAYGGKNYAIEMDQADFDLMQGNAQRFRVKNLIPVLGRAPDAWATLPDPDSVFLGGTGREVGRLVELAYQRLRNGGRLVANVGSIESLVDVHHSLHQHGAEVKVWMVNLSRGTYQLERIRFESLNPTFLLSVVKPR